MKRIKDFLINNFIAIFIIYFCTLFIDTTSIIVDYSIVGKILKVIRYIVYLLFTIRIILILPEYKNLIFSTKWKEKPKLTKFIYIIISLMIISLIICAVKTTNRGTLFVIFVLVAAYNTDYKKIFKTTMVLQIVLTSIIVLMSVLNFTQDYLVARDSIQRHSLGFLYPTNLVQMFMFSSILYIYSIGIKIAYRELFVMQITNGLLYSLTNTRAEFFILEIIIIAMIIIKLLKKYNKDEKIQDFKDIYTKFFSYTFPIYPIISLIMVMCYQYGGVWNKINKLLSNRLKQTYKCITLNGIRPFGNKIDYIGLGLKDKLKYGNYTSNFVDNEYIQLMLSEGFIFMICFIIIISILLLILYKKKKYKEVILCSVYLMFGLINPRIVDILYCPILFMVIPTLIDYNSEKQIKNE